MSTTRTAPPENGTAPALQPAPDGAQLDTSEVGRAHVREIQRTRMIAAITDVVAERGVSNMTVAHIVLRAGVSRRTFYEIFEDCQDCFLAAFDEAVARLAHEVLPAYEEQGRRRERIRAGLLAALSFLDREPGMARLLLVESLGAGPEALARRARIAQALVAVVEDCGGEARRGSEPTPLTGEGVVGAILAILHGRVLDGAPRPLVELTNPLMGMIVLPYHGLAAARRELEQVVPSVPVRPRQAAENPLRELDMRLTYRTVRVLAAVAANPGSSNRGVADGAGIADQGQISKLLARLQGLGLIENNGAASARGEPNSWILTATGWEVHGTVTRQKSAL